MKKVFTIAIALSALGLVLAGCASGGAEGEAPKDGAATTGTAPTDGESK